MEVDHSMFFVENEIMVSFLAAEEDEDEDEDRDRIDQMKA